MDPRSFDRIITVLGTASSRRAGIAAGLAAAIGGISGAAATPSPAGHCGKRKSSTCEKDSDCCSGRCNPDPGKSNLDGLGRCRCSRRNDACTNDKDCCSRKNQGLVCTGGVCAVPPPPCIPVEGVCTQSDVCCSPGVCDGTAGFDGGSRGNTSICCIWDGECTSNSQCCNLTCDGGTGRCSL
ncbi:MAG: hypothetical protein ACR2J8_09875 [Thermomicrobiales bacterium]